MTEMPPWSHSSLTAFETCPYRYYQTKVLKAFPEKPTEQTIWGNRVHMALEKRLKENDPLPEGMEQWEPLADFFAMKSGELIVEQRYCLNRRFQPCEWSDPEVWVRCIIDVGVIDWGAGSALNYDWKGLPLDTKIPTPLGFTTMGDLKVGNKVFDRDGKVCMVQAKSGVHNRECFKLTFDDATSVVCDDEHRWVLTNGAVVSIADIALGDKLPLPAPLQLPYAALPIDPYVLGIWIADGKHTSSEITKPDTFIWEEVQRRGYTLGKEQGASTGKCRAHTVLGIRSSLVAMGLLGNKHIPKPYLRASYQQRLDLLRGLMDGDGNANPTRKQAVFTTCDKVLSDQVAELLSSLGQRVNQSVTTQRGFGLEVTAYPLAFRPQGINPFLLPRKANRIAPTWGLGSSWCRRIVSKEVVESVPTQCISVDSADNTYLCTERMIPTHNTGKKKPDINQLQLSSAILMHTHDQIDRVKSGYVWLASNELTDEKFKRDDLSETWQNFLPRVARMERAFETDEWKKHPSGLCKNYCPVKTCPHHKEKKI